MTEHLTIDDKTIAYDLLGEGPLVVLAHGIGDSRRSYRFLAPALAEAGYRVANVDIRGCGESSLGGLDPDWADPRAEGARIIGDLPTGVGELAVIEAAGHYPHAQTPDEVLDLALPFLSKHLARA